MEYLGNHLKNIHSESDHSKIERLTETIKTTLEHEKLVNQKIFDCSECGKIFPTNDEQRSHIEKLHTSATVKPKAEVPDKESLTKNTADLKKMLEAISREALTYEEDVFEKDFKEILNSNKTDDEPDNMLSYKCNQCQFKASSKSCLKIHVTFVHEDIFYKCDNCPMVTRTELALHYHIDIKHNNYWAVDDEDIEILQHKQIPDNLKKYFPEDHVILNIKADGLCGVTCGSAHIFAQPTEGKEFRIVINKYIVSHWEYHKHKIPFPYERQVGISGKVVKFNNPMDFQNFLQTPEADFLWTDAEEIQIMCNMYQMNATIVKVADNENNPPTINHVGPDDEIKKLGLPNTVHIEPGKVPHMFLLLRGAHYDLAVPKYTMKEKYVSQPKKQKEETFKEKTLMEFTCNFCDRTFETDHGRGIHAGKMHKEDIRKDKLITCDMCDWSGCSKEVLKSHIHGKHIE